MAGEVFEKLSKLGRSKISVEGSGVEDYLGSPEEKDVERRNLRARVREQQISADIAKNMAERKQLRETYGTTDPERAKAIHALVGDFNTDLIAKDMAADPVGARARLDRALAIAGRGGVQDAPAGPPQLDRTYYRVNPETGTPEFTNRPEVAAGEGWRVYESRGGSHKDLGAPGGSVGRIGSGAVEGMPGGQSLEDIALEGKIDRARAITEIPDRRAMEEVAKGKYFDEKWKSADNIDEIRDSIQRDLERGILKERKDLTLEGLKAVDAAIAKRGRTRTQMNKLGPGASEMYKPFSKTIKSGPNAGLGADPAEPTTILNPEGGTNETTKVQQSNLLATSEANAGILETMPTERQKMIDFARGKVSKQSPTSKTAGGGKGKGILEDVGGYLEGEGRAGYGESGPMGVAKDIAGFYGPRLPGDILSAVGGIGTKRALARGAKSAMKIRAIENMFGRF